MWDGMNGTSASSPTGVRPGDSGATASGAAGISPWRTTLRSVDLTGPAGRLEAILNSGAPDAPYAALVCHPNPEYGGTMHHKVVYRTMKVLNAQEFGFGYPVLRFNFRGTGRSQGSHDGKAEVEDVLAALDWLDEEFHRPLIVAGFSFGSAMALWACCGPVRTRHAVRALIALGLPTQADGRAYHYRFLHEVEIAKLFLSGDHDDFGPAAQLAEVAASAADPKRLIFIPGADHFFKGQLEPMQQALASWIREQVA
jgi:alpha/beta superfamily hydrolase